MIGCSCAARGFRMPTRGPSARVVGMPLLLGSRYGLLGVPLFVMGLGLRAILEERLLKRDLPGHSDYGTRVRYRLVPGVW
jgi:protein-S-isoprenylcysteine O-methyltransferase Ste14